MKKLFTLVAFLTLVMGAKAEWVEDYKIDYSSYKGFPFYVMGYVPEFIDGVMTDFGAMYKYVTLDNEDGESSDVIVKTQTDVEYYKIPLEEAGWHQYFIADGIPTEIDGAYTVKAMVKASEACTINVNMGWGWGNGEQTGTSVEIGTEWAEVEWEYSGIGGTSCNLVAQPGTVTATIEWKWLTVGHNAKASRPTTWQEWLTSDGKPVVVETTSAAIPTWMGNAETPWADPNVRFNDQTQNFLICAWGKEKGVNMNDDGGWDPFPATIEAEEGNESNHVFVVHGKVADTDGDASAWDNQFWIESPKPWKEGDQLKIHFRYKASQTVTTNTQVHHQNPSDYQHWQAIGDITFTTEWQEFDKVIAWPSGAGSDAWSIAFNLNPNVKDAVDFYFDDMSWQSMVLDEGYFVAGSNPNTGLEYDFDNAVEFTDDPDAGCLSAVVGEKDAYVSQVMISTIRGNDAAFKSATLKPSGAVTTDPDNWLDYTEASLAKINLPGEGVWRVYLDPGYRAMTFEMVEGNIIEQKEIVPNPFLVTVNALERDYTSSEQPGDEEAGIAAGTGQPWDNQFWIYANRKLATGEATVIQFKYKASQEAKTSTQCHGEPGSYLHWAALGDVNFTTDWQDFEATFTVPSEANNMQSIAFNMAEIKEACTYELKDFVWKLDDDSESLIDAEGGKNFFIKVVGGPVEQVESGINTVVSNKKVPTVTYNLAGQRVSKDYKGIVVKNGRKQLVK